MSQICENCPLRESCPDEIDGLEGYLDSEEGELLRRQMLARGLHEFIVCEGPYVQELEDFDQMMHMLETDGSLMGEGLPLKEYAFCTKEETLFAMMGVIGLRKSEDDLGGI